jgi:hypothetical protein
MKVAKYRTHELLDSIFTAVYPQEVWAKDVRNVRKMYKACDALLNAPERPAEAYEKAMNTFDVCLKKYVAEMNALTKKSFCHDCNSDTDLYGTIDKIDNAFFCPPCWAERVGLNHETADEWNNRNRIS